MGKIISSIFGGGAKAPTVSQAPVVETEDEKKKAKQARAAIFATEGGIKGQELQPGQVSQRPTLFGN